MGSAKSWVRAGVAEAAESATTGNQAESGNVVGSGTVATRNEEAARWSTLLILLHLEVTNVASSKFQCQLIYYLCLTGAFYSLWFTDLLACSCIKITHVTVAKKKIKMGDKS